MKNNLSLVSLLLLICCSLSCTPSSFAIEEMKSKTTNTFLVADGGSKQILEAITKANSEIVGLKFNQLIDYESSDPGRGYDALWKTNSDFFEIHILTFGRRDIATSFNVKDAGQYINEKSLAILSFLQMRQRERDNNMQDDGVSELTTGKYKFLTRFLKYSVRGIPVNNVILSTSLNGKIFGFNIVLVEKSEDEAKSIIESIIKEIPRLLNAAK